MKVIINIPCLNEEKTLPLVLNELPKSIEGIDEIVVQVVDDGSTDKTSKVALSFGCRVLRHKTNLGLGTSFKHGVEYALENGCDIFINTDADNQYPSRYIKDLIIPILNKKADIVIGNRQPWKVKHFSFFKRILQYIGNGITRNLARSDVPDTVSGFRAYNREALLKLNVTTKFSYVLDTIVQASRKGLVTTSIPIETNAPTRSSRLFKNIFQHMRKSGLNVLRCYALYEPFKLFFYPSFIFSIPGIVLLIRFFIYYFQGYSGYVQSLIISIFLLLTSLLLIALAILAEMIGVSRSLVEENLYLQKKIKYEM